MSIFYKFSTESGNMFAATVQQLNYNRPDLQIIYLGISCRFGKQIKSLKKSASLTMNHRHRLFRIKKMGRISKHYYILFILLLVIPKPGQSQNADIDLLKKINPDNPNSAYWKATSNSAFPLAILIQGSFIGYDYFTGNDSVKTSIIARGASKLVVVILTEGLKYAVNRPRPYITYPGEVHPIDNSETGLSFPSMHTSVAFNTAAAIDIRYHKWYFSVPAYLWAASVGYSRMYLGMHYPSDVIAGAILGVGSAYITRWLGEKLVKKSKRTVNVANLQNMHLNSETDIMAPGMALRHR